MITTGPKKTIVRGTAIQKGLEKIGEFQNS